MSLIIIGDETHFLATKQHLTHRLLMHKLELRYLLRTTLFNSQDGKMTPFNQLNRVLKLTRNP